MHKIGSLRYSVPTCQVHVVRFLSAAPIDRLLKRSTSRVGRAAGVLCWLRVCINQIPCSVPHASLPRKQWQVVHTAPRVLRSFVIVLCFLYSVLQGWETDSMFSLRETPPRGVGREAGKQALVLHSFVFCIIAALPRSFGRHVENMGCHSNVSAVPGVHVRMYVCVYIDVLRSLSSSFLLFRRMKGMKRCDTRTVCCSDRIRG